jgi:hypothetical protein
MQISQLRYSSSYGQLEDELADFSNQYDDLYLHNSGKTMMQMYLLDLTFILFV